MKLHAGSLYKNYLVLYGSNKPIVIQVDDKDLQWDIYCNDVEFEFTPHNSELASVQFNEKSYLFFFIETDDPMKTLGFGQ